MLLWAKAIPRRFRLHDTRHTTATLLLAAGVDLYAVARILRHTDPKITFETYAHLVPGYLHAQIDKFAALVLHEPPEAGKPPRGQLPEPADSRVGVGAPGRSRTCGPRLRRPLLYPAELQARGPLVSRGLSARQAAVRGAGGTPSLTSGSRAI